MSERGAGAFTLATLAVALCLTSGCFCTPGVWGWARQTRPRSRVVGLERSPEGEDVVILSLRNCPDLPDGQYALKIPAGWQDQPVRTSIWGSDVPELAEPVTSLLPVEQGPAAPVAEMSQMTKLRRLEFPAVTRGRRPLYGGDYGVMYVRDEGRFSAEVFGYVDARNEWVRLGGVPLDSGRASLGRTVLAALSTPATVIADFMVGLGVACGARIEWPRYMSYVPRFTARLDLENPRGRVTAAKELRRYGLHAKVAVPALRRALGDGDASVRDVAVTLKALCPQDTDFYVPGVIDALRTGSPGGRRNAAQLLGEWRIEEAVPALVDALRDDEHGVRREAAKALGPIGTAAWKAVPALRDALQDTSWQVRRAAKKSLSSIQGQVTDVAVTDAFHEYRPDETSLVAVPLVSNETADMDYPALTRRYLAPGLEERGYRAMPCEECDAKLRQDGITQGGQVALVEPRTLGELLGADFLVLANVENCGIKQLLPWMTKVFTASFKMVHAPTGELLWKATGHGEVMMPCPVTSCVRRCVSNALSTLPGPGSEP